MLFFFAEVEESMHAHTKIVARLPKCLVRIVKQIKDNVCMLMFIIYVTIYDCIYLRSIYLLIYLH